MPDHVHLIFTPLVREMATCSLAEITNAIKGAAAHKINQALQRKGRIWQSESFDHVIRSSESLGQKIQPVPVRPPIRGLAGPGALGPGDGVHLLHSMGDTFAVMRTLEQAAP